MAFSNRFPGPIAFRVSRARCAPISSWFSILLGLCNAPRLLRPATQSGGNAMALTCRLVEGDGRLHERRKAEKAGPTGRFVGDLAQRRIVGLAVFDLIKMARQVFAKRSKAAPRGLVSEHLAGLFPGLSILQGVFWLPAPIAFQPAHPSAVPFNKFFQGKCEDRP